MAIQNPIIRKAKLPDTDAIVSCIDAAYAQYADRISDLPPVSAGCAEEIRQDRVWVALHDSEIAGALFLVPKDRFMKLANLAVHPRHGGKGLGSALIGFAGEEARRQGYFEMQLNTHALMPENIGLYEKLGWIEFARNGNIVSLKRNLQAI